MTAAIRTASRFAADAGVQYLSICCWKIPQQKISTNWPAGNCGHSVYYPRGGECDI